MCILHNRLCLSEKKELTQVIWSFDSSDKTWNTLCSFDLNPTGDFAALLPIAILDKGQLLLQGRASMDPLVIHDLHYRSYDLLCRPKRPSVFFLIISRVYSLLSQTKHTLLQFQRISHLPVFSYYIYIYIYIYLL